MGCTHVHVAVCRLAQIGGELDTLPEAAFLHGRLHPANIPRQPAVPRSECAGAHAADVGRQEHVSPPLLFCGGMTVAEWWTIDLVEVHRSLL